MLLQNTHKQTLLEIFSAVGLPVEVWAYGSRINGTAHEGSDLDLVVRSADLKRLPPDVFSELCDKIRESRIPILVELRDWALLPDYFHRNIEQQYEVLFNNKQSVLNEPSAAYKTKKNNDSESNK